ncbi:hypothetical protein ACFRCI_40185 [Streptomyces sp. NPDC056638]|uniref:hypothetical protein n=1 Tax=Streptomyces sp. NPDC056638 TaxID=3345887 RepID=UPI0036999D16
MTEATPQNTDVTATNTSDAMIHRSRRGERVCATTDPHHTQPAATQHGRQRQQDRRRPPRDVAAGQLLPGLMADLDQPHQVHRHLDRDHHPHQDPQTP